MHPFIRMELDKKSGVLKITYNDRIERARYYSVPPRTSMAKVLSGEVILVQDLSKE